MNSQWRSVDYWLRLAVPLLALGLSVASALLTEHQWLEGLGRLASLGALIYTMVCCPWFRLIGAVAVWAFIGLAPRWAGWDSDTVRPFIWLSLGLAAVGMATTPSRWHVNTGLLHRMAKVSSGCATAFVAVVVLDIMFRVTDDAPLALLGKTATARITGFEWDVDADERQVTYTGYWTYEFNANGNRIKGADSRSLSGEPPADAEERIKGKERPIRYLPSDPTYNRVESRFNSGWGVWIGLASLVGVGVAGFRWGLKLFEADQRDRARKTAEGKGERPS